MTVYVVCTCYGAMDEDSELEIYSVCTNKQAADAQALKVEGWVIEKILDDPRAMPDPNSRR
jgi:hypothetical protein